MKKAIAIVFLLMAGTLYSDPFTGLWEFESTVSDLAATVSFVTGQVTSFYRDTETNELTVESGTYTVNTAEKELFWTVDGETTPFRYSFKNKDFFTLYIHDSLVKLLMEKSNEVESIKEQIKGMEAIVENTLENAPAAHGRRLE